MTNALSVTDMAEPNALSQQPLRRVCRAIVCRTTGFLSLHDQLLSAGESGKERSFWVRP
jgi:hypothetical protein